jgi:hypothetical protein
MVNKGLSNHFQVSHTINLSTAQPGYRFGATYVGTKQFSPSEAFPILLGDIDPSGNLNANIIHQFTPRIRCKFASQVSFNCCFLFFAGSLEIPNFRFNKVKFKWVRCPQIIEATILQHP